MHRTWLGAAATALGLMFASHAMAAIYLVSGSGSTQFLDGDPGYAASFGWDGTDTFSFELLIDDQLVLPSLSTVRAWQAVGANVKVNGMTFIDLSSATGIQGVFTKENIADTRDGIVFTVTETAAEKRSLTFRFVLPHDTFSDLSFPDLDAISGLPAHVSIGARALDDSIEAFTATIPGAMPPLQISSRLAPIAVPEPSTWTLMILGFGSAGALLRRRAAAPA